MRSVAQTEPPAGRLPAPAVRRPAWGSGAGRPGRLQRRFGWISVLAGAVIVAMTYFPLVFVVSNSLKSGQNIFIYRDSSKDGVAVEVGVEVSDRFEPVDDVVYSETPQGDAAVTTHTGSYSGLGAAHEAIIRWCKEHGVARTGVWWELYGDWQEDPARLETEVYYSVRR